MSNHTGQYRVLPVVPSRLPLPSEWDWDYHQGRTFSTLREAEDWAQNVIRMWPDRVTYVDVICDDGSTVSIDNPSFPADDNEETT